MNAIRVGGRCVYDLVLVENERVCKDGLQRQDFT